MTRMIFVRHGESTGNETHSFYGHFDGGLTERGRAQARAAAEFLKDYKIDIAYGSDLSRAYETGTIIAEPHGLEVIPDKELREIYAGEWENLLFAEIGEKYPEEFALWKSDIWNAMPVGGEKVSAVAKRVRREVWRLARENDGKTVLIATHATPVRSLVCEWMGIADEQMREIDWVKNASVSIVDYDTENNTVKPVVIGEAEFLGEIATQFDKKEV